MIKLIINPKAESKTLSFNQPSVVIGSAKEADISLAEQRLQKCHVKIEEQSDRFVVINTTNDPFVTLNGLPFGKKVLKNQDTIQIGQVSVEFEGEFSSAASFAAAQKSQEWVDTKVKLPNVLESAINSKLFAQNFESLAGFTPIAQASKLAEKTELLEPPHLPKETALHLEQIAQIKAAGSSEEIDIEALVREVEELELKHWMPTLLDDELIPSQNELSKLENKKIAHEFVPPTSDELPAALPAELPVELPQPEEKLETVTEQTADITPEADPLLFQNNSDFFQEESETEHYAPREKMHPRLSKFDDESEKNEKNAQDHSQERINWRFWMLLLITVATLISLVGGALYFSASAQSMRDQVTAAEGVSDVAMALAYAQVNHIKPQEQNWFDPNFLKNNLASVVSSKYPSLTNIDAQGVFSNCPYILRIYTSSDLSQFLLIAQPEASLLHWLVPKTAIVVDSKDMELRSIADLRALNRLLVNPNTLDEINTSEISTVVKQGDLISLASLEGKRDLNGFAPPKALSLVRPGAENLIYNAPRYYQFGEDLLHKAILLIHASGGNHEMTRLRYEAAEIAKFPDIVLYSSQGMQKAIQGQKALGTFVPTTKFMIAYLNFNNSGLITSSHLILGEDSRNSLENTSHSTHSFPHLETQRKLTHPPITVSDKIALNVEGHDTFHFNNEFDSSDPLFLQLTALSAERTEALKGASDQMTMLLKTQNESIVNNFIDKFQSLLLQYERIDLEQQEIISKALIKLYQENTEIPLAQFGSYVKAAGLETFAMESLSNQARRIGSGQLTQQQFSFLLGKIQGSMDFEPLSHHVKEAADLLTLEHLTEPDRLVRYQNEMRAQALQRLSYFILSQNGLSSSAFNEENRTLLSIILKNAWVTDSNEHEFYLNEFDQRMKIAERH